MLIVHNITQVITELILVDDDGNVVDRKRGQQDISALSEAEFIKAYEQVKEFKQEWQDAVSNPSN